jgi:hypothetical protein
MKVVRLYPINLLVEDADGMRYAAAAFTVNGYLYSNDPALLLAWDVGSEAIAALLAGEEVTLAPCVTAVRV